MRISVPTEVKNNEYRVALTPSGVHDLVRSGHEVVVQAGAGAGSSMPDAEYVDAGALRVDDPAEVWGRAELVMKVKEPIASEYAHFRDDLTLFTYLHLAADRPLTERLIASGMTAIAYETVQLAGGGLPLLAPMSEVAGRLAPLVGAHTLMRSQGGLGLLMSGVPGTRPARVTVIGGGVAGANAAVVASGMGADVTIYDTNIARLRMLDDHFGGRVKTAASNPMDLGRAVVDSDLVIGSVLIPGARAPKLVTSDMVERMRPGSVLVDIAVDQGGCFEDTHPTTHDAPTFPVHDTVFYCVANMPGAVPNTSTSALTNATLPYARAIAANGWRAAMTKDGALAAGLNITGGSVVNPGVAAAHDLPLTPLADVLRPLGRPATDRPDRAQPAGPGPPDPR
ncbi:alanine dehydrogenase [Microbacterium sp. ZKA21]|uniref:alanine dehydrogenase n=1 Tax=Microbacterium sp. ZKA21 TaxID=3381694 RepID=UPI003D23C850